MKSRLARVLVIFGQILIFLAFSVGLWPLATRETNSWLLAAYIGIVSITGLMLLGWLVPSWRDRRWFWWVNLIWTGGWLLYFGFLIAIVIIAINRLASLG